MARKTESVDKEDDCAKFNRWLCSTLEKFTLLPPAQQSTTLIRMVCAASPESRYHLLLQVSSALHKDILTLLPLELVEKVCSYVDCRSLLCATRVSQDWNRIISSLSAVWRSKCRRLGDTHTTEKPIDWKARCVLALTLLESFRTGSAFVHQDVKSTCVTLGQITGLDHFQGLLFGSADDQVGVWSTGSFQLVGLFSVPYRINCLNAYNTHSLAIGHSTGHVTTWNIKSNQGDCEAQMYREFRGHTGVVMSVSVSPEIGLLVSGATDFTARVWCLRGGGLLHTLSSHNLWVVQVFLPPPLSAVNVSCDRHSLVTVTRDHIRVYSWLAAWRRDSEGCLLACQDHGSMETIDPCTMEIPLNHDYSVFTPGCHFICGKLVYVRQSKVREDEPGNAQLVFHDLTTGNPDRILFLGLKVRKLLAVGTKFGLILLHHMYSCGPNLLVVDLYSGESLGGCYLPHSSSSTPDLGQLVVGNTGWLDGLGRHHPRDLIVAQGQLCGQIRVVTWSDKTQPSTCWDEAIKIHQLRQKGGKKAHRVESSFQRKKRNAATLSTKKITTSAMMSTLKSALSMSSSSSVVIGFLK
uniref:F-box domain-containing protein n=1 Tax=Timema cristinae TaxID=61476 RepID=A0A7R9GWL8_TIMCR|nr:unnamed protein product [Timema cristinae]